MQRYANLSGEAGVVAYAFEPDAILIEFTDGAVYRYDEEKPGREHVENMRWLAEAGRGLTTYINKFVRENHAGRVR